MWRCLQIPENLENLSNPDNGVNLRLNCENHNYMIKFQKYWKNRTLSLTGASKTTWQFSFTFDKLNATNNHDRPIAMFPFPLD